MLQQTPSAQTLDRHSVPVRQPAPFAFLGLFPQLRLVQAAVATQSLCTVHVVRQWAPPAGSQLKGAQTTGTAGENRPPTAQAQGGSSGPAPLPGGAGAG